MDHTKLERIAGELRLRGLDVSTLAEQTGDIAAVWAITDRTEDTIIRVIVLQGVNGNPTFWPEAFNTTSARFVTPIILRLGDVVEQICRAEA
ncbi:hypothetical protein [Novosphingobium sp. AP12]|uniref:hypothetical protein n=1 Tax=Novosphingobium sp. AP12 TaxID=1144305 RepID=UPI000271DE1E|nr:hypothetical protein [Novosphingobium sp. AP12]EJL20430.1 hypothetical protein PMI02_05549 [Novosphingobium sp. AP12]